MKFKTAHNLRLGKKNFRNSKFLSCLLFFETKPPRAYEHHPSYRNCFPRTVPPNYKFRRSDIMWHVVPESTKNHREHINRRQAKREKAPGRPSVAPVSHLLYFDSETFLFNPNTYSTSLSPRPERLTRMLRYFFSFAKRTA